MMIKMIKTRKTKRREGHPSQPNIQHLNLQIFLLLNIGIMARPQLLNIGKKNGRRNWMSNGKNIGKINMMMEVTAIVIATVRARVPMIANLILILIQILILIVEIVAIGTPRSQQNGMNQVCKSHFDFYNLYIKQKYTAPKPTSWIKPEPTKWPTPEPTWWPTPEPTKKRKTPKPTKYPTPEPTEYPTPEPTKWPTPEPWPTPKPTKWKLPTPEPTKYPTPEPTTKWSWDKPTPKPTDWKRPDPTKYPTPEPTKYPTPEPTKKKKPKKKKKTPEPTKYPTPEPTKKKKKNYMDDSDDDKKPKKKKKKTPEPTKYPTPEPTKKSNKWGGWGWNTPKPTPMPTIWHHKEPKVKRKGSNAAVNGEDEWFGSHHFQCADYRNNGDIDYVILVDASCGLSDDVSDAVLDGLGDVIEALLAHPDSRIAFVTFGETRKDLHIVVNFDDVEHQQDAKKYIRYVRRMGDLTDNGNDKTNLYYALKRGEQLLDDERETKFIILNACKHKECDNHSKICNMAQELTDYGVETFVVNFIGLSQAENCIKDKGEAGEYLSCLTDEDHIHYLESVEHKAFDELMDMLLPKLCLSH